MSATEAAPSGPQHHNQQNQTGVLLACAGGTLIGDAFLCTGSSPRAQLSPLDSPS